MNQVIIFWLLLILIPIYMLVSNIELLALGTILVYALRGLEYYKRNRIISFIEVWNLGFIYIVIAEMIQSQISLTLFMTHPLRFILVANVLVNLGFMMGNKRMSVLRATIKNEPHQMLEYPIPYTPNRQMSQKQIIRVVLLLLGLAILFFVNRISRAILAFVTSRGELLGDAMGGGSMKGMFFSSIGIAVPVIATYIFRYQQQYKGKTLYILTLLLIIIPQFLWGTRYVLLYSVVAPIIVMMDCQRINFKKMLAVVLTVLMIIVANKTTVENRAVGNIGSEKLPIAQRIASYGSNEGIVRSTNEIFKYIETNGYSYGKESAFVLYFWVPRSLWPGKPTQLSYWLPRHYRDNLSPAFSAAYGFWGELLMDFGYFALILYLLLGCFLGRIEMKKNKLIRSDTTNVKLPFYYIILGGTFFAVRSPQTVIINILYAYLLYYLVFKLGPFLKRIKIRS